jgi:hypothetical protein
MSEAQHTISETNFGANKQTADYFCSAYLGRDPSQEHEYAFYNFRSTLD